jgi:predicted permease
MTDWRAHVARLLPDITGDPRRDAEIRDELAVHCADRAADYVRAGLSAEAADDRTRAELQDLAARGRDLARAAVRRPFGRLSIGPRRPARGWRAIGHDVAAAARGLVRAPGFAAVSLVTIALALGAAIVVFSVVRAVLLRPLPLPQPDRVVTVFEVSPTGNARNPVASGNYLDWVERVRSFAALAAIQGPFDVALSGDGDPQRVRATSATPAIARVLQLDPVRGRWFDTDDAAPNAPRVVLLTHDFWQSRFGGRDDIVGETVRLDDRPFAVLGVLPRAAHAVFDRVDVLYPIAFDEAARAERRSHNFFVIGRLAGAVTVAQATAEMRAVTAALTREHPQDLTNWSVSVVPTHADAVRETRPLLTLLLAVVLVVLGIAAANLAGLQAARASRRAGEMAVRAALGASRLRLAGLLLAESGLLWLAGLGAGLALAAAALPALVALAPFPLPFARQISVDAVVILIAAAAAVLCSLLVGLAPLAHATRARFVSSGMSANSVRATGGGQRARQALVAVQVALTLVLLIAAALLVQSLLRLRAVDHGFDPDGLLAIRLDLPRARYADGLAQVAFYEQLTARLRAIPGVTAAAGTTGQPAVGSPMTFSFAIHGRPSTNPTGREHPVPLQAVTTGYFETMRIPVRRGRPFTADDRRDSPPVVVINEALARLHWPGGDAVGQRFSFRPGQLPWLEIVGVVGDTRDDGLDQAAPPTIYVPFAQKPDTWRWMSWQTLVVRADRDPVALVPAIRDLIRSMDPSLPVLEATPVASWFAQQGAARRFAMQLIGGFAAIAALLVAIGVYGVLSYTVSARRREIGIRAALGASRPRLVGAVVRTTLVFAVGGLAVGAMLAIGAAGLLGTLLYGVEPTDPWTYVVIGTALLALASVAAWIPARRALSISPLTALRD